MIYMTDKGGDIVESGLIGRINLVTMRYKHIWTERYNGYDIIM